MKLALEGLKTEAGWTTEEQPKPGPSMERVKVILRRSRTRASQLHSRWRKQRSKAIGYSRSRQGADLNAASDVPVEELARSCAAWSRGLGKQLHM